MKTLLFFLAMISSACAMTPEHEAKQEKLWKDAKILPHRAHEVQVICDRIQKNLSRYKAVEAKTGVPWHVIAGLHNMESSGSFFCHLHEGTPMKYGRTRYVPKGRPVVWNPPNTWEASAQDALNYDKMGAKMWSDLGKAIMACEGYNGWGYYKYHPGTPTQYNYAATTAERPGKYTGDGVWSSTARSKQVGNVAVWKELERRGIAKIPKP